ncbi:MAG: hypothetical protein ACOCZI_01795 [Marinilabiliaceae bacterium]
MSCGPSPEEQAGERLDEAMKLRDSGQLNMARMKLDTVIEQYGDLTEQVADAKRLLNGINLIEQKRSLEYLDSMITEKEAELEPLLDNFITSDEYGSETIYIHRRQRPENSYHRTFIRAHLDASGDFYISSRYHGKNWLRHNQIRVYNAGKSVKSEEISEDSFNNRRFEDGKDKFEIVRYKEGADNGIVDFIASNVEKSLKVEYIGDKHYFIVMEQFDKEAIRDAYETSFVLQELDGLKKEKRSVEEQIRKLERREEKF